MIRFRNQKKIQILVIFGPPSLYAEGVTPLYYILDVRGRLHGGRDLSLSLQQGIRFLEHPLPTNVYVTSRLHFLTLIRALLGLPSLQYNTIYFYLRISLYVC